MADREPISQHFDQVQAEEPQKDQPTSEAAPEAVGDTSSATGTHEAYDDSEEGPINNPAPIFPMSPAKGTFKVGSPRTPRPRSAAASPRVKSARNTPRARTPRPSQTPRPQFQAPPRSKNNSNSEEPAADASYGPQDAECEEHEHSHGLNGKETASILVGWVVVIVIWLHLFWFIPVCESAYDSTSAPQYCRDYYGSKSSDDGHHWYFWLVLVILYAFYLAQSFFSPCAQYLDSVLNNNLHDYVKSVKAAPPKLWWQIHCYHYDTHHADDPEGQGWSANQQVRVDTHSAEDYYEFDSFEDISPLLDFPKGTGATRIRCDLSFAFADEFTRNDYEERYADFIHENDVDTYKDIEVGVSVEGYHDYLLAFTSESGEAPCSFHPAVFWIMTVITLNPIYRMYFYWRTESSDFDVVKVVKKVQV